MFTAQPRHAFGHLVRWQRNAESDNPSPVPSPIGWVVKNDVQLYIKIISRDLMSAQPQKLVG